MGAADRAVSAVRKPGLIEDAIVEVAIRLPSLGEGKDGFRPPF